MNWGREKERKNKITDKTKNPWERRKFVTNKNKLKICFMFILCKRHVRKTYCAVYPTHYCLLLILVLFLFCLFVFFFFFYFMRFGNYLTGGPTTVDIHQNTKFSFIRKLKSFKHTHSPKLINSHKHTRQHIWTWTFKVSRKWERDKKNIIIN